MKPSLYLALYNKIEEWSNEMCENGDWPDIAWGEHATNLMTKAAVAVFDACQESQEHGLREGYFKKK